ncbi:avidin-like isoform C [Alligator mississippiensis]|uniref:Avidin-like isoform C n=1 Tax=Alligator mississippiensis TaxID=8496 RepID=A0A151MYS7_ALLMI|nr:avidin-like isoform C [Alligator mississippiensis]
MAVSATQAPIRPALLCRSQQLHGEGQQPTFGFTVNWKSFSGACLAAADPGGDSTTVFVGQCFVDKSREESLHTMWLLREEVKAEKDDWKATRLHLRLYWECRPPPTPSHQPGLCTGSTSGCQLRIQHGVGPSADRSPPPQCSLLGLWQNDLGSEMNISAGNNAGKFFGTYLTKVSATHKPIAVSPLRGSQQMGNVKQPTFGFTVTWSFTDSTTVFVGQCFVDDKGKETLQTMWLLRKKVDSIEDNWQATLVGTNNFTRLQSRGVGASCRLQLHLLTSCPWQGIRCSIQHREAASVT